MQKRLFFSALSAAVVLTAGYCGYRHVVNSSEGDLFLANVEALSEGEFITDTSWHCSGDGVCAAKCPQCGTTVGGTGKLKGEHHCIKI